MNTQWTYKKQEMHSKTHPGHWKCQDLWGVMKSNASKSLFKYATSTVGKPAGPVSSNLCFTSQFTSSGCRTFPSWFDSYSILCTLGFCPVLTRLERLSESVNHSSHTSLYSVDFWYVFFFFVFFFKRKCGVCQPKGGRKYPLLILVFVVSSTNVPPHKAPSVWGSPVRCVTVPLMAARITSRGWNMER